MTETNFRGSVVKIGNSKGVTIPPGILKFLDIDLGSDVEIQVKKVV